MELEPVIGLEIHVQLKTKSKMFCPCDNTGEDQPANITVCPVCMGHPGTLPVPNAEAIHLAGRAALALNLVIAPRSKFDRKNYFYPDLPKGYQISQYDEPFSRAGWLEVETKGGSRRVGIERMHLEEDTAKLTHVPDASLVDFNRSGTPLAEIVTKPDIRTPEEAGVFLRELRLIMRAVLASDADMEKGHLRCDANVSLRPKGDEKLYPKTEVKNLNSFRAVEKALAFEIERQAKLWEAGTPPTITSTRGWDEKQGVTVLQREKEAVHDYRYFPEPDIPPLVVTAKQVEVWRSELPELPADYRRRLVDEFGIKPNDAKRMAEEPELGKFVESVARGLAGEIASLQNDNLLHEAGQFTANWTLHKLLEMLEEVGGSIASLPFTEEQYVQFLGAVYSRQVNSTNAKVLLRRMYETKEDPDIILQKEALGMVGTRDSLAVAVAKVLELNSTQVAQYRAGKTVLLKYFVGLVMKQTKGTVNPEAAEIELQQQLGG